LGDGSVNSLDVGGALVTIENSAADDFLTDVPSDAARDDSASSSARSVRTVSAMA
jgi:hypothetical protein